LDDLKLVPPILKVHEFASLKLPKKLNGNLAYKYFDFKRIKMLDLRLKMKRGNK